MSQKKYNKISTKLLDLVVDLCMNPHLSSVHNVKPAKMLAVCADTKENYEKFIRNMQDTIAEQEGSKKKILIDLLTRYQAIREECESSELHKEYVVDQARLMVMRTAYIKVFSEDKKNIGLPEIKNKMVEQSCERLKWYLMDGELGGAKLILSCLMEDSKQNIFNSLCDRIVLLAEELSKHQTIIAKKTIKELKIIRKEFLNDKSIEEYIEQQAELAARYAKYKEMM